MATEIGPVLKWARCRLKPESGEHFCCESETSGMPATSSSASIDPRLAHRIESTCTCWLRVFDSIQSG
jgi:hypothetical protein